MSVVTLRYESAQATLTVDRDTKIAKMSRVYSKQLCKGHGAGAVDLATTYADKHGLTLVAEVRQFGNPRRKTMNEGQLIGFYKKFGFVIERSKPKPVLMVRKPS